ncbi:MAG: hypothetical protein ACLPSW_24810, partial [Roseiarcus sp.]
YVCPSMMRLHRILRATAASISCRHLTDDGNCVNRRRQVILKKIRGTLIMEREAALSKLTNFDNRRDPAESGCSGRQSVMALHKQPGLP